MTEIGRRIVHASGALAPLVYLVGLVTWDQLRVLLAIGLGVAVVLEIVRLRIGLDWWIYENLTRAYEREQVAGYALYMVGMATVAWLFEPVVAVPAMFMLTIGDPIGGLLGSGGLRRKSPTTMAAVFVVCFVLAVPVTVLHLRGPVEGVLVATIGAAIATLADGIPMRFAGRIVDDNLTIPLGAGVGMWLAILVLT